MLAFVKITADSKIRQLIFREFSRQTTPDNTRQTENRINVRNALWGSNAKFATFSSGKTDNARHCWAAEMLPLSLLSAELV